MIEDAIPQLVSGLGTGAVKLFPRGLHSTYGIVTCATKVKIFIIDFDDARGVFVPRQIKHYNVDNDVHSRAQFIVDLFKIARFFIGIGGPNSTFHLVPGMNQRTDNGHGIRWVSGGIIKHFRDISEEMSR